MKFSKTMGKTHLCKKDGYEPREFTDQQLEAMGKDPGGQSYDGWSITEVPSTPDEAKLIKPVASKKEKAAKVPDTPDENVSTKTTIDDATTRETEGAGEHDNIGS